MNWLAIERVIIDSCSLRSPWEDIGVFSYLVPTKWYFEGTK